MKRVLLVGVALLAIGMTTTAQESANRQERGTPTKATYLITGLHCPPCARTVESSLSKVPGIVAVKVDWKSKSAHVEFDEAVLPVQRVAHLISATPHMMGGNMRYVGWLALAIPELKDDATGQQIEVLLRQVKGVKRVVAYPAQHSIGVAFDAEGDLTSLKLIDVLKAAGFQAENL